MCSKRSAPTDRLARKERYDIIQHDLIPGFQQAHSVARKLAVDYAEAGKRAPVAERQQYIFMRPQLDAYLQTGVFFINGQRCIGLRYWDPNYETTEIDYDFDVDGTRYSDTVELDQPVGY